MADYARKGFKKSRESSQKSLLSTYFFPKVYQYFKIPIYSLKNNNILFMVIKNLIYYNIIMIYQD